MLLLTTQYFDTPFSVITRATGDSFCVQHWNVMLLIIIAFDYESLVDGEHSAQPANLLPRSPITDTLNSFLHC
jgi:hypothetical protein